MSDHHDYDIHKGNAETRAAWFFKEFWPIILFASLFLTMVTVPLVFSGLVSVTPFALFIVLAFLGALIVTFFMPRALGGYLLLWALALFATNEASYNTSGFWITLGVLVPVSIGMLFLPQRRARK